MTTVRPEATRELLIARPIAPLPPVTMATVPASAETTLLLEIGIAARRSSHALCKGPGLPGTRARESRGIASAHKQQLIPMIEPEKLPPPESTGYSVSDFLCCTRRGSSRSVDDSSSFFSTPSFFKQSLPFRRQFPIPLGSSLVAILMFPLAILVFLPFSVKLISEVMIGLIKLIHRKYSEYKEGAYNDAVESGSCAPWLVAPFNWYFKYWLAIEFILILVWPLLLIVHPIAGALHAMFEAGKQTYNESDLVDEALPPEGLLSSTIFNGEPRVPARSVFSRNHLPRATAAWASMPALPRSGLARHLPVLPPAPAVKDAITDNVYGESAKEACAESLGEYKVGYAILWLGDYCELRRGSALLQCLARTALHEGGQPLRLA